MKTMDVQPTDCLKPTQLPATLKGTLITNQIKTKASMVPKGTAPLEPLAQTNKLRRKKVPKMTPGRRRGVRTMFRFQASPPNDLYTRAET